MDLIAKERDAALVVRPLPHTPEGQSLTFAHFLPGETLGQYVERNQIVLPRSAFKVWHNARPVPMNLWDRLIPRTGDQILIKAIAQGGGGGGGKVLRTVAMLALVIAAPYVAPALGFATGTLAASLITGAVMIGGSLLINALLPPPKPTLPQLSVGSNSKYESSPTYAIAGGRNRARPWEPMTVIFGRHKVVPDLAANYYTEYVGDDQYLNQAFHFGLQAGELDLVDFKIGQTPISNYQGIQLQVSGVDGRLSLFPGNVDTVQGFTLQSGVINSRTTERDVTYIAVELAAQLFYIRDDGGIDARTTQLRIQYRPVGGGWADIGLLQDAVYATHYWSLVVQNNDYWEYDSYERQVTYGSSNYADHYPGEQVIIDYDNWGNPRYGTWRWMPHPASLGQPWQGYAPDPLIGYSSTPGIRMTGARQEPTRQTVAWSVPKGQYEVRVWKESGDVKNSRESNETAVNQILAYQTDEASYTGQQRVALRIKATSQLNGAVDEFNAVALARTPVWNGSGWVVAHTRNPAWWFLNFARGKFIAGKRAYGAGLLDSQVDFDRIKAWALFCDAKGLTFDYVLDRKVSTAEVLQTIARAGRASPTWQTGKLGVIWDAANLPASAMFGPFNIKAGSFKVDYINEGNVDEVIINFSNESRDYEMDEVRVIVPGATSTTNPLQLDLEGCTNATMAGREANLIAASQIWHRRRTSWETDIEGWVANRGDVVQISHDLTVWGYSGRLLGRTGNVITLDKHVPSGGTGTLMIRDPDGNMRTVSVVSVAGGVDQLTIIGDMSGFALPGDAGFEDIEPMDWAWFFDPLATPGRRFKITSVEPTQDGVKFSAVDDDAEYYASEFNPYLYVPPKDGALLVGLVFSIGFTETLVNVQADVTEVQASWVLSRSMSSEVVVSINGQAQPAVRTEARSITIPAKTFDVVTVMVTPIGTTSRGRPLTQTYRVQGLTVPLPTLTSLNSVFRDGLTVLVWDRVIDIRQPVYEIRTGPSWANSRVVAITPSLESLAVGNGLYWVAARFSFRGAPIYGQPDSLQISGATLVRNVLLVQDEAPGWSGTMTGGAIEFEGALTLSAQGDVFDIADVFTEQDVAWYGGPVASGIYTNAVADQIDIGFVTPVRVDFDIQVSAINLTDDVFLMPDIFTIEDILRGSDLQYVTIQPQIRQAQVAGEWTDWKNYAPGLINARYFDIRIILETRDSNVIPFVEKFQWTIDLPDLLQRGEDLTVPTAGVTVTYEKTFHAKPNLQVTIMDAQGGDQAIVTDDTQSGFRIAIINAGSPVARTVNWIAQGY